MGFPLMDTDVKRAIDLSLDRIALVLDQNPRFKRLMYSCDEQHAQLIGVKIFERTLSLSVREYISQALHSMDVWEAGYTSLGSIRRQELKLLRHALLITEYHAAQLPVKFRNAPQSTGMKRPLTAGKSQSLKH
jgi:homoserine acetyltransferase